MIYDWIKILVQFAAGHSRPGGAINTRRIITICVCACTYAVGRQVRTPRDRKNERNVKRIFLLLFPPRIVRAACSSLSSTRVRVLIYFLYFILFYRCRRRLYYCFFASVSPRFYWNTTTTTARQRRLVAVTVATLMDFKSRLYDNDNATRERVWRFPFHPSPSHTNTYM